MIAQFPDNRQFRQTLSVTTHERTAEHNRRCQARRTCQPIDDNQITAMPTRIRCDRSAYFIQVMRSFLLVLLLLSPACQHGVRLRGQVTIPAETLRGITAEHPAELVVQAKIPASQGHPSVEFPVAGVALCSPPRQATQQVPVSSFEFSCAPDQNAEITAWIVPRSIVEVNCLGEPTGHSRRFHPERGIALAEGHTSVKVASSGHAQSSCKSGSVDFDLTVGR